MAGVDVTVAVLRGGGGFSESLERSGVELVELASAHDVPLRSYFALSRLLSDRRYDVVHAWRLPALRAMALVRDRRAKLVASQSRRGGRWNWLDRRMLSRIDHVVPDWGEGDAPPPAAVPPETGSGGVAADGQFIFCVGRMDKDHGFRDAVWAFDVLKFVVKDARLVLVGEGPERERIAGFSRAISAGDDRVHFRVATSEPLRLPAGAMLWSPSRKPCGEQVVLEAQAAGCVVIASRRPGIESIIRAGETGLLVPPREPIELAKAARRVSEDAALRQSLGESARRARASGHAPDEVAARWREIYAAALGGR